MKQNTFVRHLFALFIAFSFIPMFLSGNDFREANNDRLGNSDSHKIITCNVCRIVESVNAEELLSSNTTRITRCDTSRRLTQPKCFDYCFKGSSFLLFAAGILFLTLYHICRKICHSRRFIIKYIHDQDGHKNMPSYY